MEALAAQYDVGFSGETGFSPNNRIALGNKLFSYLLAGIPIIMSDSPAHQALARELGQAAQVYCIDDPVALASTMDKLLLDKDALSRARRAAWQLGQSRFNWGVDSKRLIGTVRAAIHSGVCRTIAQVAP
jgi:glycosyltransferase involved in cell wall biosynthesis